MDALLRMLRIDPVQWRTLTGAYLVMDFRRSTRIKFGGSRKQETSALAIAGMFAGALLNSVLISLMVLVFADPFTAASLMVLMTAVTVAMLLLIEFVGSVVSAEDYWIIAPRPVSSRTYFAARFSAVLIYVSLLAGVMCFLPGIILSIRHGLGLGGFLGAITAGVLTGCSGTGVVVGVLTSLMARVHPSRLVRTLSWVQLLGSALSLSGFLVVIKGFDNADIRNIALRDTGWIWYVPTTWFASIVTSMGGVAGSQEWLAAAVAVVLTVALLTLAAGRMSLEFASRLAEATTSSQPERRRARVERLPGFGGREAYAVATLIRAQFRYDLRFRLGILGIIPMTGFYLFLGWSEGALTDPFNGLPPRSTVPIYMAVAFLPMILHGALQYSDQWRAAWIFWASPADPSRLVLAAKNFVTVFFLGAYTLLSAIVWSFFYDHVWHAFVHAAFVGAAAHLLLQATVILNPALPFARAPVRGEQSSRLFALMVVAGIGASAGPLLLSLVYPHWWATLLAAAVVTAVTVALERLAHRRVRKVVAQLEWA